VSCMPGVKSAGHDYDFLHLSANLYDHIFM